MRTQDVPPVSPLLNSAELDPVMIGIGVDLPSAAVAGQVLLMVLPDVVAIRSSWSPEFVTPCAHSPMAKMLCIASQVYMIQLASTNSSLQKRTAAILSTCRGEASNSKEDSEGGNPSRLANRGPTLK